MAAGDEPAAEGAGAVPMVVDAAAEAAAAGQLGGPGGDSVAAGEGDV
jgi:hypothetical protein